MSYSLIESIPTGLFIDGRWHNAVSRFGVINPATGEVLTSVADASASDARRAMDAASAAAPGWAATPARHRAEILRRAFDTVAASRDQFALLMTLEMGKPLEQSLGEVAYGGEFLRWFSEQAVRVDGRFGSNPEGTGTMVVSHRPVGPSYLVTPWNFPLAMATRKIAPALAAGCTMVVKPAELTPLTTLLLAHVLHEAGVPAGVLNVLPTTSPGAVSDEIIGDHRLRKLSFTGSTAVGRSLMAQSAKNVLRTSMELGGNAPFLVFDDADLDAAVNGAIDAKFRNMGQACTAANRFLVHESVAAEFTRLLVARVRDLRVGAGVEADSDIGPVISHAARERIHALVTDAVRDGATLHVGGAVVDGPGYFYEPTVLSGVRAGSRILSEEIFGPVVSITTFSTEERAVALANDTEYGLVSYVYTRDLARGTRMIDALETGMMGLNTGVVSNAAAPFGGIKQSGIGREGGTEGIQEYLTTKYTLIPNS